VDLNGDGHDDVISGQYTPGIVNVWYGGPKGFGKKTTLQEQTFAEKPADGAKPDLSTWMSTANFTDWDGDGDYDMIVGNVLGAVMLNINDGTAKKPKFGVRKPLKVGDRDMKVAGKSDPLAVDWDGDGRLDTLSGTEAGDVFFFHRKRDGSFAAPVSALNGNPRRNTGYKQVREQLKTEGIDLGYRLRIETADWNNDGLLDLLVGNCFQLPDKKGTSGNVYVFLRKAGEGAAKIEVARPALAGKAAEPSDDDPVALSALLIPDPGSLATGVVTGRAKVASGWHLYGTVPKNSAFQPTTVELELPEGVEAVGDWILPPTQTVKSGVGTGRAQWKGNLVFTRKVRASKDLSDARITASFSYQVCTDELCYPPRTELIVVQCEAPARERDDD